MSIFMTLAGVYFVFAAAAFFAAHRVLLWRVISPLEMPTVHTHAIYTSEASLPHVLRPTVVEATPAQKWLA
jgi:hypothetical protein